MDNRPISKALLPIDKDRPLEWLKIAPGAFFFNWPLCRPSTRADSPLILLISLQHITLTHI
jgi:hypothetical protein